MPPSPLPSFLPPDDTPPETLRARAGEWRKRLEHLYGRVGEWLPPGFSARTGPGTSLYLTPENNREAETVQADTLLILRGDAPLLVLKPKGLWTLGARARVDVLGGGAVYLLADLSPGPEAPDWRVAGPVGPDGPGPFNRAALLRMLEGEG